ADQRVQAGAGGGGGHRRDLRPEHHAGNRSFNGRGGRADDGADRRRSDLDAGGGAEFRSGGCAVIVAGEGADDRGAVGANDGQRDRPEHRGGGRSGLGSGRRAADGGVRQVHRDAGGGAEHGGDRGSERHRGGGADRRVQAGAGRGGGAGGDLRAEHHAGNRPEHGRGGRADDGADRRRSD